MRAPRLTPEARREVERFGIHGDDALAALGGVLILVLLGGAVLAVAFQ